ncbi:hypothetical protein J4423_04590 [Candidatus Pacearchaeota archaeon]|nr:hypothetical protein [Candidatus Pacearchaeota archaeon]
MRLLLERLADYQSVQDSEAEANPIIYVLSRMDRDINALKHLKNAKISEYDRKIYYEILGIELGIIGFHLDRMKPSIKTGQLHVLAISQKYESLLGLYNDIFRESA